jgi:hypothetical protein
VLDRPEVSLGELCEVVTGPDFPTGGIIMGRRGILQAYATGRGLVRVRARHSIEEVKTRQAVVVTEVPFQVRKTAIIEKIVEVVKDGRITGISDVRDESDRSGIRLVIELKKGEDPQVIVNQLYQYTPMQTTQSIINLVIDRGQPRTLNLRGLLDAYIAHRKEVIRRRTQFLLRQGGGAQAHPRGPAHRRRSHRRGDPHHPRQQDAGGGQDRTAASRLRPVDAPVAGDRRHAARRLDRPRAREARGRIQRGAGRDRRPARHPRARRARRWQIIKDDLDRLDQKYGDERRTEISVEEVDGGFDIEELINEEMMAVTVSRDGYIKRTPLDVYRTQGRGGRGIIGSDAKEGDMLRSLFVAGTHDFLLCFSNKRAGVLAQGLSGARGLAHLAGPRHEEPDRTRRWGGDHQRAAGAGVRQRALGVLRHAERHGQEDAPGALLAPQEGRHPRHQPGRGRRRGRGGPVQAGGHAAPGLGPRQGDSLRRKGGTLHGAHVLRRARHPPPGGRQGHRPGGRRRRRLPVDFLPARATASARPSRTIRSRAAAVRA